MISYARCSRCHLKKKRDDLRVVSEPCVSCGSLEVDISINPNGQPDWWDEPERDPVKHQPRKARAADRVLAFFRKPPRSGG